MYVLGRVSNPFLLSILIYWGGGKYLVTSFRGKVFESKIFLLKSVPFLALLDFILDSCLYLKNGQNMQMLLKLGM